MVRVVPRLLGGFFAFATFMCAAAAWSLLSPGGPAGAIWSFKTEQYRELLAMGPIVGFGFCFLAVVTAITSAGCFAAKAWGWRLAIALIGINALADGVRALAGETVEGLLGLVVAGGIVWVLLRSRIRAVFQERQTS